MAEEITQKTVKNPSRFIFCMSAELRHEIKMVAARRNVSMSLWVTRAIYEALRKEKQYDTK